MGSLGFSAAMVLGATFVFSATGKLRDPDGFALGVVEYDILSPRLAAAYGKVLPAAELLCGVALLLGAAPTIAASFGLALLGSFSIGVGVNLARGRRINCHCFDQEAGEILGWMSAVRLCALIACGAVALAWPGGGLLALPTTALPAGLLAVSFLIALHLAQLASQTWQNWRAHGEPAPTLYGGRVSLRDQPLARPAAAGQNDSM